jgi:1-acyl-sn-glycerol-3-phosphate acyltransferase
MIKKIFLTSYSFLIIGIIAVMFIPVVVLLFLIRLTGQRGISYELMYKTIRLASKVIVFCINCELIVNGQENIPSGREKGICFICNHSGILDILLLFITAGRPFGFIAKKEIMFVPFINLWLMLLGGIFMDRNSPRKSLEAINHGIKKIKNGYSMAVFPEGTRSRGRGLLPFRTGSFRLATESEADIVPVAITGSYEVFEKTGWICSRPVYVSFGKVISASRTADGKNREYFSAQARAEIERLLKLQEEDYNKRIAAAGRQ